MHKGDFGRVGIVAGSRGLTGAAVMCANACVRAGAGLVSLYVTEDVYSVIAYYLCHRDEVEAYLQERRGQADELRRQVEERSPSQGIRERLLARRSGRP